MFECLSCGWEFNEAQLDGETLCGSCSEYGCPHNKLLWNCIKCTETRQEALDKIYAEMGLR